MKNGDELPEIHIPGADSATLRIAANDEKIKLLTLLNDILHERRIAERKRNSLLQNAVLREHQVQETRIKCESLWLEKISEAEFAGRRLEIHCVCLRERKETLNKQLMASIDGGISPNPIQRTNDVPSIRANYKILACQLQKEIVELRKRVSNADFRLKNETKCKTSLNSEIRRLRNEADCKKQDSQTVRPTTMAIVTHPAYCRPTRESFRLSTQQRIKRPPLSRS